MFFLEGKRTKEERQRQQAGGLALSFDGCPQDGDERGADA